MLSAATLSEICQPEVVLPAQLVGGARRDAFASGPRALMLAVLEDAIRCLQVRGRRGRRDAAEAAAWIRSRDLGWPCSFERVCTALDIHPGRLRTALLASYRPAAGAARPATAPAPYDLKLRMKPPGRMLDLPKRLRAVS